MTSGRPTPPPAVKRITRRLEEAGFETWAVGGAIRDALLERKSEDWDLATRARPEEVQKLFRRTVPVGVEHGTVGILDGPVMYEITTFRKDVETDGRHAVVAFAQTLEEDLARRDFTINAIAWHTEREEFRDPFHGRADLQSGMLRTVGKAEERFQEDYLRILRALRFAGRFRLELEERTWSAMRSLVGELPRLSPERIRDELLKVLELDPTPSVSLELYRTSGALAVLYPELKDSGEAAGGCSGWDDRLAVLDHLPPGSAHRRLAAFVRGLLPERAAALLLRLRISNHLTDSTAWLAGAAQLPSVDRPDAEVRRWLSNAGPTKVTPAARLELAEARAGCGRAPAEVVAAWVRARDIARSRPPVTIGDLALDGSGLKAMGLRPGPGFGRILGELLEWVIDDPARNQVPLLEERALSIAAEDGTGG